LTNNAKIIAEEIYEEAEGLKKIEVVELPPKIKWGEKFQEWEDEKKISYLTKFAESMNHAADVIQRERDALCDLIEQKEEQLIQIQPRLDANNRMIQEEITKMNEYKQEVNSTIAKLNARIRELESVNGNVH